MADPYVGEIRPVGFNFQPVGWSYCDGRLLSIEEFPALFQLIGTIYGGDGETTFAVPDLRGRLAVHQGAGFVLGQEAGEEAVTVTLSQLPSHGHFLNVSSADGTTNQPNGNFLAVAPAAMGHVYGTNIDTTMNAGAVGQSGGTQPHENMQPSLVMNYIICLEGVFPPQP